MTKIELTQFLKKIGVAINKEQQNDYRWASRPIGESKPTLRFRTLKDAEKLWTAHSLYILYHVRRIEESIKAAAEANPEIVGAIARWLDPSTRAPYPTQLREATASLPEYTHPRHWKTEIIKQARELGPVHDEWTLRRACYYRTLAKYRYHGSPTGKCEPSGDEPKYSRLDSSRTSSL
ncbi:hypothetical protein [Xanthomonas vesicatoria]|uniref:hypothetical protein n=1 Tax=Xanthomonas vesicatoria TaxID=56460 RepID=UPI000F8D55B4|nr:hypothetical protein [Xanthomonas vesicatoria]MCC8560001.1 hypothetical protein [Xanthomonas vesicatoria]MCC8596568.1 hypothetical protein [Xanthomonas vesicatoria]MCC8603183.1 hypothetical protein [Xanthomonas vesicatoria]MCC8605114.1 hypothetical protein [Xanthomonas vesicatoria]MCC8611630.1 hypothetical protein [Xanthomonas vesicatoria]